MDRQNDMAFEVGRLKGENGNGKMYANGVMFWNLAKAAGLFFFDFFLF